MGYYSLPERGHYSTPADTELWDEKIDRTHPGVDPTGPGSGEVGRPLLAVLPRSDLRFRFVPHHLGHDPLEHGQEGIGLGDELR